MYQESIMERKKILDELTSALDEREEKVKQKEADVMKQIAELKEMQGKWERTEQRMKANYEAVSKMVTLIVGMPKHVLFYVLF